MKSYSWTKLLLDKGADATEFDDPDLQDLVKSQGDGLMKLPFHKTPTDVAGDYLWEIYKYFMNELEKRISPEILRVTPMEFWFTVPAMWGDKAKDATRQAALKAKFASRLGDRLYMIPEPEAAAVAILKSLTHDGAENQIKPNDGVLICDCGVCRLPKVCLNHN
jgi:molecular chaperone DnaK (HSP70)